MLQAVTIYRLVHVGSGKGDPDAASAPALSVLTEISRRELPSLLSRISFSFPILDPSVQIFMNPAFRVAVKSLIPLMLPIPRCSLVESVSYLTFPKSRTLFWSNPVSRLTFPESSTVFCLNRGSREDPSRLCQYDV